MCQYSRESILVGWIKEVTMKVVYANLLCLVGSISLVPCVSFASFLVTTDLSLKGGAHSLISLKNGRLYAKKKSDGDSEADESSMKKSIDASKKMALEGVLSKIERSYGRGSVVKLGDADTMKIDSISSGSLTLGKFGMKS